MHDIRLYSRHNCHYEFTLSDEDWAILKSALHGEKHPKFVDVFCHDAGTTCGIRIDEYILYEEKEAF